PKLIALNGGYNHHCPPPRRQEHSSAVFNPVSALGGKSVFGSKPTDDEIIKTQRQLASRDLYNNQDGTPVTEISMHGEQPWGYRGLQPMYQFVPYIPATQELNACGRTYGADPEGTDLTKREEYTGEFYSRKPHVL